MTRLRLHLLISTALLAGSVRFALGQATPPALGAPIANPIPDDPMLSRLAIECTSVSAAGSSRATCVIPLVPWNHD